MPPPLKLIESALSVRMKAYAPFSNFRVGAAIISQEQIIYTGCNVECSSYGLSLCAERVAITKGVSEGAKIFTDIAIASESLYPCPPCGACRQFLFDFAPELRVWLVNLEGSLQELFLKDLLPGAFTVDYLDKRIVTSK